MAKKIRKSKFTTEKILQIALSPDCEPSDVLYHMEALCNILRKKDIELTTLEKMGIVKSMARAKVRAYMLGSSDDYKIYSKLDSISNDLVQLL